MVAVCFKMKNKYFLKGFFNEAARSFQSEEILQNEV